MKKTLMLPLAAMVSGLLVGCGGGSSGGGGGGAPSTRFDFMFSAPNTILESSNTSNCTVYEHGENSSQQATVLTYQPAIESQLNNENVIAYYSDATGARVGDLIVPSDLKLSFTLEGIPDDGFITFQTREANNTHFTANTFSKEYLEDLTLRNATFGMNREAVSSCNKGDNFNSTTRNDLSYLAVVSGGGNYIFQSQLAEASVPTYSIDSLDARALPNGATESTIVTQFKDGYLHQYGVRDWSNADQLLLVSMAGNNGQLTHTNDFDYSEVEIKVTQSDFSYDIVTIPSTQADFAHPDTPNTENWSLSVESDTPLNGWNIDINKKLYVEGSWDVSVATDSLFDLNSLPVNLPTLLGNNLDLDFSFTDEIGKMRVAYTTESLSNGLHKLTHKLFIHLKNTVVVPELHYYDYSDTIKDELQLDPTADPIHQTVLIETEESDITGYDFLTAFAHGNVTDLDEDLDGLVINEVALNETGVKIQNQNYLMLSK
ncbi:hypothetical protein ISX50_01675 [Vibrio cyclitrophicus]|nr:hypothetical protein [Vibrio cyclitrophicus]UPR34789.1 hypothetical protein ISX50_01675 [Vibrio cyclitrophicus]